MGISRDSMHKRRATGGKKKAWRKKRKYELGRQPANTKLSSNKTVRRVRVRGGNVKWRALRLDTGNYSWGSEAVTRKTRILDVVYNASNNELVRTQTLVKSAIVQVDAAPFKQWYLQHYGVDIGRKKKATTVKKEATEEGGEGTAAPEETKKSNHVLRKLEKRQQGRILDLHVEEQFGSGRLLACISSRPGQCGRADGYILEGKELEFYMKKLQRKKGKESKGGKSIRSSPPRKVATQRSVSVFDRLGHSSQIRREQEAQRKKGAPSTAASSVQDTLDELELMKQ
ncbi:40S ribosomal protein S8-2 [Abeliophyllum distichum]|uniref:40S ribosomal protein S8 n=1 Tax=Abeliophyllum distichum TaxID=126358 RepID=A0ABD1T169_9LAMI